MRVTELFCAGGFLVLLCAQNGCPTVLSATMLMSFMGGYLMGKMTLGTFLMMMSGLNNIQTPNPSKTREQESSTIIEQSASTALENQMRDKFLRQLGEMDPLNCLPKVFCQLSSSESIDFFPRDDEGREKVNTSDEEEETSDSQSDETPEDLRLKRLKYKENERLESLALDEMADDADDPMDMYFILKERQKFKPGYPLNIKKSIQKRVGAEEGVVTSKKSSSIKIVPTAVPVRESDIDDIFADDPFFDEFSRSMNFELLGRQHPRKTEEARSINNPRLASIAFLSRRRREVDLETDFGKKFQVAASVGRKFQNSKHCKQVFPTCPFEATQIMSMVNTLKNKNVGGFSSTIKSVEVGGNEKKNENLLNLKNTLLAIESINNATILAKKIGSPVSYSTILEEVEHNPHNPSASLKIMAKINEMAGTSRISDSTSNDDAVEDSSSVSINTQKNEIPIVVEELQESSISKVTKSTKRRKATSTTTIQPETSSSEELANAENIKSPDNSEEQEKLLNVELPTEIEIKSTETKNKKNKKKKQSQRKNHPKYINQGELADDVNADQFTEADEDDHWGVDIIIPRNFAQTRMTKLDKDYEIEDDEEIASPEDDHIKIPTLTSTEKGKKKPIKYYGHSSPRPIQRTSNESGGSDFQPAPLKKYSERGEDDEADADYSQEAIEKIITARHAIKPKQVQPKPSTKKHTS